VLKLSTYTNVYTHTRICTFGKKTENILKEGKYITEWIRGRVERREEEEEKRDAANPERIYIYILEYCLKL